MKIICVMPTYFNLRQLYEIADGSKARRGLFGYMLKCGRLDHPTYGGAMHLLKEIESLKPDELYKLKVANQDGREVAMCAEIAMAGGFDKFAVTKREIKSTLRSLKKLDIDSNFC